MVYSCDSNDGNCGALFFAFLRVQSKLSGLKEDKLMLEGALANETRKRKEEFDAASKKVNALEKAYSSLKFYLLEHSPSVSEVIKGIEGVTVTSIRPEENDDD